LSPTTEQQSQPVERCILYTCSHKEQTGGMLIKYQIIHYFGGLYARDKFVAIAMLARPKNI
jgi:hypothetical protein